MQFKEDAQIMLRSLDALQKAFEEKIENSRKECEKELDELRKLILRIEGSFLKSIDECCIDTDGVRFRPKFHNSLAFSRLFELFFDVSTHILTLCFCGIYRDAFDNVRYVLESLIQALYIDMRHPEVDVDTKIEILKEVEGKREYHAVRLMDELEIDHKDKLRKEYKELSRLIHPSHEQILLMREKLIKRKWFEEAIDCKEISKIHQSTRVMYDIFFFLFITHFPEMKKSLMKNSGFVKDIRFYRLGLTSRVLKVRLDK